MKLGAVIADFRWANRIGGREFAREIGVSNATLSRFERGENCDADTLTKILTWLFAKEKIESRRALSDKGGQ